MLDFLLNSLQNKEAHAQKANIPRYFISDHGLIRLLMVQALNKARKSWEEVIANPMVATSLNEPNVVLLHLLKLPRRKNIL